MRAFKSLVGQDDKHAARRGYLGILNLKLSTTFGADQGDEQVGLL
jgi:hypothetical protein